MRRSIMIIFFSLTIFSVGMMIGSADTQEIYLEENDTIIVDYENPKNQIDTITFDDETRYVDRFSGGTEGFIQDEDSFVEIDSEIITDMKIRLSRQPTEDRQMTIRTSRPTDVIVRHIDDDRVNRTVYSEEDPTIDLEAVDSIDDRYEIIIPSPKTYEGTTVDETPRSFTILPTERSDRVPIGLSVIVITLIISGYIWYHDDGEEWR